VGNPPSDGMSRFFVLNGIQKKILGVGIIKHIGT
jgi:hypothetical protein